jgi:hypothetical protein
LVYVPNGAFKAAKLSTGFDGFRMNFDGGDGGLIADVIEEIVCCARKFEVLFLFTTCCRLL